MNKGKSKLIMTIVLLIVGLLILTGIGMVTYRMLRLKHHLGRLEIQKFELDNTTSKTLGEMTVSIPMGYFIELKDGRYSIENEDKSVSGFMEQVKGKYDVESFFEEPKDMKRFLEEKGVELKVYKPINVNGTLLYEMYGLLEEKPNVVYSVAAESDEMLMAGFEFKNEDTYQKESSTVKYILTNTKRIEK